MTIEVKATVQYIPVVPLIIMLNEMVLTFECLDEMLSYYLLIESYIQQKVLVMLYISLSGFDSL